jgi:hypothetical protein
MRRTAFVSAEWLAMSTHHQPLLKLLSETGDF